mgnify:CR=1 FL=1
MFGNIILILVLIWSAKNTMTKCGPADRAVIKGRGSNMENINILLSRILWVSKYKKRIDYKTRFLMIACVITLILSFVIQLQDIELFYTVFIVWLILFSLHKFFDYHLEKFSQFYTVTNTKIIRKKLQFFTKIKTLPTINVNAKDAWNYSY